jgi:hypothetical protein
LYGEERQGRLDSYVGSGPPDRHDCGSLDLKPLNHKVVSTATDIGILPREREETSALTVLCPPWQGEVFRKLGS